MARIKIQKKVIAGKVATPGTMPPEDKQAKVKTAGRPKKVWAIEKAITEPNNCKNSWTLQ